MSVPFNHYPEISSPPSTLIVFPVIHVSSDNPILTTVLAIYLDFRDASIVHAINGFPAKSIIFFPGNPFDPLRAGMIDKTLLRAFRLKEKLKID